MRTLRCASGPVVLCPLIGAPGVELVGDLSLSGGAPVQKFRKAVMRCGTFFKASEGLVFQVEPDTLANWVTQFNRMKANGVTVPLPATHRTATWEASARKGDPRDNLGWCDSLEVVGDELVMTGRLIGQDAITAGARSHVSINSPPSYVDGNGNRYPRPITHIALVTDPVVTGLGAFTPLAASLAASETQDMLEFMKKLAAALGLDPESIADEEAGAGLITQAIEKLVGAKTAAAAEGETPPTKPEDEEKTAATVAASSAPSPMVVKTLQENRVLKLTRLAEQGKISTAQKDKLAKSWASTETVSLALSSGSDGSDFDDLVSTLDMGEARKPGAMSGVQTMSLSDGRKNGEAKPSRLVAVAERRAAKK